MQVRFDYFSAYYEAAYLYPRFRVAIVVNWLSSDWGKVWLIGEWTFSTKIVILFAGYFATREYSGYVFHDRAPSSKAERISEL